MEEINNELVEKLHDTNSLLDLSKVYLDELRDSMRYWMCAMEQIPNCFCGSTSERNNAMLELKHVFRNDDERDCSDIQKSQDAKKVAEKFITAFKKTVMTKMIELDHLLSKNRQKHGNRIDLIDLEVLSNSTPRPSVRNDSDEILLTSRKKLRFDEDCGVRSDNEASSSNVTSKDESQRSSFQKNFSDPSTSYFEERSSRVQSLAQNVVRNCDCGNILIPGSFHRHSNTSAGPFREIRMSGPGGALQMSRASLRHLSSIRRLYTKED